MRHAGGSTCTVSLGVSGEDLLVEIADDGRGVPADAVPGVGSTSMRERAAELGGSLDVTTTARRRHHRARPPARWPRGERTVRVLVVDDHPVYRDGVADALGDAEDIDVVGTAADGESAVALVDEVRPDVVLMDLRMPGGGGLRRDRQHRASHPGTAVVVLTMSDDDDSVFAALRAGARGYLLKESEGADIARAVRAAARSEAVFGPRIADRVLAFFASSRARSTAVPFPELTDREREVLDLVAHGLPNAAIATRLFLSEKTVRNRVSDVLTKLHAASRAEAVALARDAGLGPA